MHRAGAELFRFSILLIFPRFHPATSGWLCFSCFSFDSKLIPFVRARDGTSYSRCEMRKSASLATSEHHSQSWLHAGCGTLFNYSCMCSQEQSLVRWLERNDRVCSRRVKRQICFHFPALHKVFGCFRFSFLSCRSTCLTTEFRSKLAIDKKQVQLCVLKFLFFRGLNLLKSMKKDFSENIFLKTENQDEN